MRDYYVTCIRDDGQFKALAGPYPSHAAALDAVDPITWIYRNLGLDAAAPFHAYGTARIINGGQCAIGAPTADECRKRFGNICYPNP